MFDLPAPQPVDVVDGRVAEQLAVNTLDNLADDDVHASVGSSREVNRRDTAVVRRAPHRPRRLLGIDPHGAELVDGELAALPDVKSGHVIHESSWKMSKQIGRTQQRIVESGFQFFQRARVVCSERPGGRPPQLIDMCALKISQVRLPAEKVMLYEEDDATIDDGAANPYGGANLLSVRHERNKEQPVTDKEKNLSKRGNVCFADMHVDFVQRKVLYPGAGAAPNNFIRDKNINPWYPEKRYPY